MKITHVMADGSRRESIKGVVIQSEDFYRVIQRILENRETKEEVHNV